MDTKSVKAAWDDAIAKLKRERDEIALKMHLGRKDLESEWQQLEAKWTQLKAVKGPPLKEAAAETAKGLGSAMEQAADELKKGYEKIRKLL